MEILKLAKLPLDAARFAGRQLLGGAWGDFGEKYGEAVGGHKVHPASIQFYTTGAVEIPDNIQVGEE